jgi:hypothetical protein
MQRQRNGGTSLFRTALNIDGYRVICSSRCVIDQPWTALEYYGCINMTGVPWGSKWLNVWCVFLIRPNMSF